LHRIPIKTWKNAKLNQVLKSPVELYSVPDLPTGIKEISDLTDQKLSPERIRKVRTISLAEALSSSKPNQSTFVTETVLMSKASLPRFGSNEDYSFQKIDSSRITSNAPISRVSFAGQNSNR
jgi:hypothetical protein